MIVLIGPPGSGKTSAGRALADLLGWRFLDSDAAIEERTGLTVAAIFQERGERAFREMEREVLEELATASTPEAPGLVLAAGGGLPVGEGNFQRLRALGPVVRLLAETGALVRRLQEEGGRPLLPDTDEVQLRIRLEKLLSDREAVYAQADLTVETTGRTPEEVASDIILALGITWNDQGIIKLFE